MIAIAKRFDFEAAHKLPYHDGKCQGLHGHSYKFTLEARGPTVLEGPKCGMVMDYKDIGVAGKEIVAMLDHKYLNDVLQFEETTAENIAVWIFDKLRLQIPQLWSVSVSETEFSSARYAPIESRVMELGADALAEVEQRIMDRVLVLSPDDCWPFLGSKDIDGYGYCKYTPAKTCRAHRLILWLRGIEIEGRVVMHTCDNPSCCNPRHLKVGTHKENEEDKDDKGRRPLGENHGRALITDGEVLALWKDFQDVKAGSFEQSAFIDRWAAHFGMPDRRGEGLVKRIITGQNWNHVTGLQKPKTP